MYAGSGRRLKSVWSTAGATPSGATESALADFESRQHIVLPPDFRSYLATVDGSGDVWGEGSRSPFGHWGTSRPRSTNGDVSSRESREPSCRSRTGLSTPMPTRFGSPRTRRRRCFAFTAERRRRFDVQTISPSSSVFTRVVILVCISLRSFWILSPSSPSKLGGSMSGAERPDGEAPKPPQVTLETSLNHEHPVCTRAPSVTRGLEHPSRGAGRVLSGLIGSRFPAHGYKKEHLVAPMKSDPAGLSIAPQVTAEGGDGEQDVSCGWTRWQRSTTDGS